MAPGDSVNRRETGRREPEAGGRRDHGGEHNTAAGRRRLRAAPSRPAANAGRTGRAAPPRLLLHVGLPKTATTSLQRNVLMPWHRTRRINFLGRCELPSGEVHYPLERFHQRVGANRLTSAEADALRPSIEALLDPDRLNVFSDERIAGMETVGEGARCRADVWLDNLRTLFRGTDATVAVCLRSPADFVLSAYAESYFWRLYLTDRYDTFRKFVGRLLAAGEDDAAWRIFFFDAYLRAVRRRFDDVRVLLYEDLLHDRPAWYAGLAACLDADPAEFERLFAAERHNAGARTASGRLSRPLTLGHLARKRLLPVDSLPDAVQARLAQRIPPLIRLRRTLARWELPRGAHHRWPDADTRRRVQRHLGLDDHELASAHGVSAEKLARYGYLRP